MPIIQVGKLQGMSPDNMKTENRKFASRKAPLLKHIKRRQFNDTCICDVVVRRTTAYLAGRVSRVQVSGEI